MPKFALFLVLALAACADAGGPEGAGDMQGWRYASGKPPSRAEYAAIVAACQDGAVRRTQGRPLDACLADLGLRRAQ